MKKITLILAIITVLVSCETPSKEKPQPQIIKTAEQIQNEIDRREYIDSTMAAMRIEEAKRN
jgi:PBP1b-binding outer membrane lipoprotein LpoB